MSEGSALLTPRGFVILRRILLALFLLAILLGGLWALEQALDSAVVLGRGYVDIPGYPVQISVWTFHDFAYALLWIAYVGLVVWEITPWKPGRLTTGRVVVALFGFALITAGLWISQDLMNAVLILHRTSVDLPFFVATVDSLQARDLVVVLVSMSYVSFYALTRVAKAE